MNGIHLIIYSQDAEADRQFFTDILNWPHVDVGDGWLIFKAPPTEIAMHPAKENNQHEIYLMCDDVEAEKARLAELGVETSPVKDEGWGLLTVIRLPGGGDLGMYQPRHARAHDA